MLFFKMALSSIIIPVTKTTLSFPFKNPNRTTPNYKICLFSQTPSPLPSNQEKWSCKACAFFNPYKLSSCEICGTRNSVDLGLFRGSKSANKKVVELDEKTWPKEDLRPLKILSYNVWLTELIDIRIRMRAIRDIIHFHSPDVICLQEVTPNIYAILRRSSWWKSYKCSVSSDKAVTRRYFCMQLSKLPVKSFGIQQFTYTAMGRELCIAEVLARGDTPLVIATSHLESPCPGPPNYEMYSKERVKQANEAVDFLKKNPNVIFCGDMNWDDKLDGEFPLPDGWFDAWTELNPSEIGWTYDTKSNLMLSAKSKLQKRLDRFLISLRDFKVESIGMVGTKPIPFLTYLEPKGRKELELPVLPSDHFGLLLTMSGR